MIIAELPLSIYSLDPLRAAADAFQNFCTSQIAAGKTTLRVELTPMPEVDEQELGRAFFNFALSASIEARL